MGKDNKELSNKECVNLDNDSSDNSSGDTEDLLHIKHCENSCDEYTDLF